MYFFIGSPAAVVRRLVEGESPRYRMPETMVALAHNEGRLFVELTLNLKEPPQVNLYAEFNYTIYGSPAHVLDTRRDMVSLYKGEARPALRSFTTGWSPRHTAVVGFNFRPYLSVKQVLKLDYVVTLRAEIYSKGTPYVKHAGVHHPATWEIRR